MAVTDADRRRYISDNVTADLQYVLQDAEISLANQYAVTQHYKNLRVFATMGDTKAEVRTALKDDFRLDPASGPDVRAEVARFIAAWEVSRELASKEQELRAEAKVLGMPRHLQNNERQAMIRAVETTYGRLQEAEVPSNEYLSQKVEECENNEPSASMLDEVTSKHDATTASLQSSLDASGHVRIVKTKTKGKLPDSSEELRRLLKLEGVTWLCMAAKFKSKSWLAGLELRHWLKYTDYVLGDRVYGIKVPYEGGQQLLRPSWTILIAYEHKLRKEAFKLVNQGTATLAEALELVVRDADLKETFFTTPLALTTAQGEKYRKHNWKGDLGIKGEKGKGKKGGKGDRKGDHKGKGGDYNGSVLVSKTPDGRELCYAYNAQGCRGKCGRVHACRCEAAIKTTLLENTPSTPEATKSRRRTRKGNDKPRRAPIH